MIPLIKPDITCEEVADDIEAILASGRLTTGPYVRDFEKEFADYIGVRHAVTTTSATTALHMSLVAMGVGAGDEVLVSDFTFPASGNAIVQTGAAPVLVDCLAGRFDLDWHDARRKITSRTRGLMVVHPFGQPVSARAIADFERDTGLWVLEDAACAITSNSDDRMCGAMGRAACFSFHPRKILTTGEGGMITTDNDELFDRLTVLRSHGGRAAEVGSEFVDNGYNYRMSEIQAALGLAQLRRIDAIVDERRRVARLYLQRLAGLNQISTPMADGPDGCSFQSFVVMLDDSVVRDQVIARMKADGIETMLGTYAMHTHPAFARFGYSAGDLPHAARAQSQSLTLPLIKGMSEDDVDAIVGSLEAAL